jgi:phosphoribosylglycinamide formyltransferase 1
MKRIVILISGRGSNMRSIVQACADEQWRAQVAAVIADRPDAVGLAFARERGIATQVVSHKEFSRDAFDAALMQAVDAYRADWVVLAGFMRILGAGFVRHYEGRMLNIHPSLLPAFPGLRTHQRAIDAGCKVVGATVHFVTPELDHGPIVAQAVVPVRADDTAEAVSLRVLEREHEMYPCAVRWCLEERIAIDGLRVRQLDGVSQLF